MQKALILLAVVLCLLAGCAQRVSVEPYTYTPAPYSPQISAATLINQASVSEVSNANGQYGQEHKVCSYPTKTTDIIKIFGEIKGKGEFESSEEYYKKVFNTIQKHTIDGVFIFKAYGHIRGDGPSIEYNADTKTATLHAGIVYDLGYKYEKIAYPRVVAQQIKISEHIGYNAFGVSSEYTRFKGKRYSILCSNIPLGTYGIPSMDIKIDGIEVEELKRLKNNLIVFI